MMEELVTHIPQKYQRQYPTPKVQTGSCHSLDVVCNGKVFRKSDYATEKEWREATARECGAVNPNWDPNKEIQTTFARI